VRSRPAVVAITTPAMPMAVAMTLGSTARPSRRSSRETRSCWAEASMAYEQNDRRHLMRKPSEPHVQSLHEPLV
jgi:hypothetical protein